jgi:hypothetical protein
MADAVMVILPGKDAATGKRVSEGLNALPEVDSATPEATRFVDPAAVTLFVQLAGSVLGVAATAVPIIQKIVETIRGKGVSGAVIELPGGGKLSVDNASVKDIERLIRASRV